MPTLEKTPAPHLRRALEGLDAPIAAIDVDAFDHNARQMLARANGIPIRVASKSLRSVAAIRRALDMEGFAGVLAYSLPEAIALTRAGIRDVVVAYPCVHRAAIRELSRDDALACNITLMVDSTDHLDYVADATGGSGATIRLAIDVDASWHLGPLAIGARRSPLYTPEQVEELAREIVGRKGVSLVGLMAYEAQIASVADAGAGPIALAKRTMRTRSGAELAERRARIVAACRGVAELEFVNGGGTGCIATSAAEGTLTEVAAGSGFFTPSLFDGFRDVTHRAAAFFALAVSRVPGAGWVTCNSGGWIASGPAGRDRLPTPVWPLGLRFSSSEGPGEVQTPLHGAATSGLRVGDLVWFRHAKAGELAEHVEHFHAVHLDGTVEAWPTYRGEGWCFR